MASLIEFPTEDGHSILVEVPSGVGGVVTRGDGHSGLFARAQQTFERALGSIQPAVQGVIDQLFSIENRPDEVTVQFGIDLHAEAGAFIAAASTSSNFNVTLSWKGPSPAGREALAAPEATAESPVHTGATTETAP